MAATAIQVQKHFFRHRDEVLDDIKRNGYWPTTLITPIGPELPVHWHDSDVHAYVIEGCSWMRDAASGESLPTEPGDKIVIPKGALHAEGATTTTMTYIVALPNARTLKEFLKMQMDPPPFANS